MRNTAKKEICSETSEKQWEPVGLCKTCEHGVGCGYMQNMAGPKIFCEEYVEKRVPKTYTIVAGTDIDDKNDPAENVYDYTLKGLCMNCEHARTCMLPRAVGGVWFCCEYE